MIKIGMLDKNALFRESLQYLVETETLMSVELAVSWITECKQKLQPAMVDVLLIDTEGCDDPDFALFKDLVHQFPEIRMVVLSNALTKNCVLKMTALGINTFYPKTISMSDLGTAVKQLHQNKSALHLYIDPGLLATFTRSEKEELSFEVSESTFFTERELQILHLVCQECTNSEIAEELELSIRTIETHRRRMIDKTHSKTMIGVILYAKSLGVILPNPDKRTLVYTQS